MQAVASSPPLGVLGLLDDLLDRAHAWLQAPDDARIAKETRIRAMVGMRDTIVEETRAWCVGVSADDVPTALLEIGRRHWRLWGAAVRCALDLEELMRTEAVLSASAQAWTELAREAHTSLPLLVPAARRDVRAAAKLLASITELALTVERTTATPASMSESVAAVFDAPAAEVASDLLMFNAALEVIFVAGHMGGIGEAVSRSAADWLWCRLARPVRDGSPVGSTIVEEARRYASDAEAPHAATWAASPDRVAARERAQADLARGYDELRQDEEAWGAQLEVRRAWEATLGDGLEGDPGP